MKNNFNIVIAGVGGQGVITLARILAEAALIKGYGVKTSELHGLSQRGGSVETHIRFALSSEEEIYSPLIREGDADLIISLEINESFKACYYGSSEKETTFLINNFAIPPISEKSGSLVSSDPSELRNFSKKVFFVPASKTVEEKFKKPVLAGVFLLGVALFRNLLPLDKNSIIKAMREMVPSKYFSLNKGAFLLAGKIPKELK